MELNHMADVSKTFDFFLRLSDFMKYQLDEILPHYITKTKLDIPDRIRDESENLLFSVTNFIKFVKTFKVEKTKVNVPEEPKKPEEPEYWPDMFFEMFKSLDERGEVSKRGFYCGLCNFVTFDTDLWNQHCKDDPFHLGNDSKIKFSSNSRVDGFYCKHCLGVFYSEIPHLEIIMNSKHHKYLDDQIQKKRNAYQEKQKELQKSDSVISVNSSASSKQSKNPNKTIKPLIPKERSSSVISVNSSESIASSGSRQFKKTNPNIQDESSSVSMSSQEKKKPKKKKKTIIISNTSMNDQNVNGNVEKSSESDLMSFEPKTPSGPVETNLLRLLEFKKVHFDSFAGLCLICDSLIDNEFDWMSHIESHSAETLRCDFCNSGFCGKADIIKNSYLVNKIHTDYIHSLK